jgi:hypothetical protein
MKKCSVLRLVLAVAVGGAVLLGPTAKAQMPTDSLTGVDATLVKLFGDITAFSAKADVRTLDSEQKETIVAPMDFALLGQKIRMDVDLTKLKSKQLTPVAAQQLKELGMEQVTVFIRPDKKETSIAFHAIQSSLVTPLAKEELEAVANPPKVEKTELGRETIDGHACVKNKVVLTDNKGQQREATTWNATDLKNFPIQIQTTDKGSTLWMRFSQVQLTQPNATRFDPPAGYASYPDMQELVMGVMKKTLLGAPEAK